MRGRGLCLFLIILLSGCSTYDFPAERTGFKGYNILHGIGADVIVRDYDTRLRLISESEANLKVKRVVTILNEDGRSKGFLKLYYDSFREVKKLAGAIYNANGERIRGLTDSDIHDLPATSSWSLYEDNRVKTAELYHNQYPYTIIYEYEIAYNGLLNLPSWYPQARGEFVENASLEIYNPSNIKVKPIGLEADLSKRKIGEDSVYSWRIKNLQPIQNEPLDPPFFQKVPKLLIGVQNFEMANTRGNMNSWQSFGNWYYSLSQGLHELSPETVSEVKSIFIEASSRKEGIKKLYEYMQSRTRYVSVQLGIGGWKPFPAKYVDQRAYGDCKALTNYMQSILKVVGVPSYSVLLRRGYDAPALAEGFPSNQFNHVVLYVPGDEPIWLESTSQTLPFNYLGNSNSDRYGLLIKPDSSYLIKTPVYDYKTNKLKNEVSIVIDSQGDAEISLNSTYSGAYLDEVIRNTAQKPGKIREEWLHETIDLNGFKIRSADFSDIDQKKKTSTVRIDLSNKQYATHMGSRIFVPLNKINRWPYQFPKTKEERDYGVNLPFSFEEIDDTKIILPEGFEVESLPGNIQKETDFGLFALSIHQSEKGTLEIHRNLRVNSAHFKPDTYSDLRTFFGEIGSMDSKNIVLRSK